MYSPPNRTLLRASTRICGSALYDAAYGYDSGCDLVRRPPTGPNDATDDIDKYADDNAD